MPISSSSVFHFTRTKSALKGILRDNFKIHYCVETPRADRNPKVWAIPMVSFCDIPLSQVKEHIGKYGAYGIGLSKDWAKKEKLSPVHYIAADSLFAKSIRIVVNAANPGARIKDPANMTDEERAALDFVRYSKNYEGLLKRPKKTVPNYRYYDEREWRYVPEYSKDFPMIVPIDTSLSARQKSKLNTEASAHRLTFDPSDIKFIIVKSDQEIGEFVDAIRSSKGKKYSHDDIERLTTRIITKEQIEKDF